MTVGELDERMSYGEWIHWLALAKMDQEAEKGQERVADAKGMANKAIRKAKGR